MNYNKVYADLLNGEERGFVDANGSYLFGREFHQFGGGQIVIEHRKTAEAGIIKFVPSIVIYRLIGKDERGHPLYSARSMTNEEVATAKSFLEKQAQNL